MVAGLTFLPRFSLAEEEKKLNFYNWDTYIGENTLADFNEATGIEVKMDLFADNDELFAKLKGGNPGYDVIVPTNDMLERMIKADMVMPLDHAKIPNMANIDEPFQDATFDPGRKFSIPYMWGTLGIGYRKSEGEAARSTAGRSCSTPTSMPARISLLGDASNVLGAGAQVSRLFLELDQSGGTQEGRGRCSSPRRRTSRYSPTTMARILLASGEVDALPGMERRHQAGHDRGRGHRLCGADRGLAALAGHAGHSDGRAASG